MKKCTIIGISDSRDQWFQPEVMKVISGGKVFSGGKRHHEIMADHLPKDSVWIDITVPLADVFRLYEEHEEMVIFASGDPLFYGFANTVQRECPECEMKVFPTFNSLQMLAHRLCMPYHDMHVVSLTGRPWDRFDEALINGESLIGCLTDRNKTPHSIWQRMQEYGYNNYMMYVGERLGKNPTLHEGEGERIREYSEEHEYSHPNCIILRKTEDRPRRFGIPEQEFHLLNGRTKMITKMPIRLCTLAALGLSSKHSFWDVGFCTGSVSIEAKLQFPHLTVTSFEVREEGRILMQQNARKFGAPGINAIIGDFLSQNLSLLPPPDAVFIGGHGGKLREMIYKLKSVLLPGGCIVFNSVSEDSRQMFEEATAEAGMQITYSTHITIDDHNPIYIIKAE